MLGWSVQVNRRGARLAGNGFEGVVLLRRGAGGPGKVACKGVRLLGKVGKVTCRRVQVS